MIKYFFGLAASLLFILPLSAQNDDDVLFSVDGKPVTVGEFRYIYGKTNGDNATFSRESVMEYLDLYERFKLKVARARDMGLDTITALRNELEGYRQQLADNYLVDREVTDRLVAELYDRQQQDVDFSHILLKIPSNAPADTLAVYRRAVELREQLTADNFAELASSRSEDTYSKDKGGRIGYVSAPLPNGMYRLEEALYAAPDGQVGGPVRTAAGYHLYLKHGTRPAYGEVEIAHILIRKGGDAGADQLREKAMRARKALADGQSFEAVAAEYSEDDKTKNQGGYIGFFGINRYNKDFEEAAFALTEDGQVSEVIESPVGFHILRRISRRGVQPLDQQRPLLEGAVKKDTRYTDALRAMARRLKREYGTEEMEDNFTAYTAGLDSSFFDVGKVFPVDTNGPVLLKIADRELRTADFETFLTRNARLRSSLQRRHDPAGAAAELYEQWVNESVQAHAEKQLEDKFPEFRALMREYREGILLFEATKLEVWDRAGEDSTGLQAYFDAHRDDYRYGPRARVAQVSIRSTDSLSADEVLAFLESHDAERTMEEFGRQAVSVEENLYEADRIPEGLTMDAGARTEPTVDPGTGLTTFSLVQEILPARRKELAEARGYVIADYQDQLEREWVEQLRKQYQVKVNKSVLNKLIRS
ncbi:peptidyl-prolyl cis-trans isomerase SurA [Lewinella aquimaris]|uniref:peptidylprolyl isomerase n=1 Tax=Neolewinella aquimaris TaxID=1835722 RepID=A0A840E1B0_9BACT|nr:peptidylprolyl isomerase [Neolewinella aquimaris]MBB4079324.1 peptidyl-prolyl cis-trans isomerase SurA [Neolewinella aquimaris]